MQALASRMQNEYATQTILERNVTKMQFQLAVYTDIVVDRIGDDMAMGAKVILVDEVNLQLSYLAGTDICMLKHSREPLHPDLHALAYLPCG